MHANGLVIPHNHPCCIFLTIFIFYGAGRAGKARPENYGHRTTAINVKDIHALLLFVYATGEGRVIKVGDDQSILSSDPFFLPIPQGFLPKGRTCPGRARVSTLAR